jgi:hypothetical protein
MPRDERKQDIDIATLLAKIKLLDERAAKLFTEEVITYSQSPVNGQIVRKDYSLHAKMVEFQKLVLSEEKMIKELKLAYEKVMAEIAQFAKENVRDDVVSVPRNGIMSTTQLPPAFEDWIKVLGENIEVLGEVELQQLEKEKARKAKKKNALVKALQRLEDEDEY